MSKASHFFPLRIIADKVEDIEGTIKMSFLMLETSEFINGLVKRKTKLLYKDR